MTDSELSNLGFDYLGELVVDAPLDVDAVGRDAYLSSVAELVRDEHWRQRTSAGQARQKGVEQGKGNAGSHEAAFSRSASSKTIYAPLPPSSSVSFFRLEAHWLASSLPT
jgi:hypothetical protein